MAALAPPLRKPVQLVIGPLHPGQTRARRAGLLAPLPLRPRRSHGLLRRWRPTWIVVLGRWHRGVTGVPREQVLQPGQPPCQLLIDPQQVRDLCGQRRDLPILTPHKSDQLLMRHLLRRGHPKIKLRPDEHTHDQHAEINNFRPTEGLFPRSYRARPRENTSRSTRRGGQRGLADPPAFIPVLVIDKHLHQAGQLQTLSRGLHHIPRQQRLPHQTKRRHKRRHIRRRPRPLRGTHPELRRPRRDHPEHLQRLRISQRIDHRTSIPDSHRCTIVTTRHRLRAAARVQTTRPHSTRDTAECLLLR